MATWLMHMRIADKVKERVDSIDLPYLMMGSVAPDSRLPGEDDNDDMLPEEMMHFRCKEENGGNRIDTDDFYNKYLSLDELIFKSDRSRSFLWGYYFHLLADLVWDKEWIEPIRNRCRRENQVSETDFRGCIRKEMDALDFKHLRENGTEIMEKFKNSEVHINFFSLFDASYVYGLKDKIVEYYGAGPLDWGKENKYLDEQMVEDFINGMAEVCIKALYA